MSWFQSWFDSPYYHLLYRHRDGQEAEWFIDHLLEHLKPEPGSRILDLACGRGRHAIYLNNKGYEVTGIDLSEQNITYCKAFENPRLTFYVHDMRHLFRVNDFDYVFNLFTSFGYFEKDRDHFLAMRNAASALKQNGTLVIDFLNVRYTAERLVEEESVVAGNVRFSIKRELAGGFFIKHIGVDDDGKKSQFSERVAALTPDDFRRYMEPCHLEVSGIYGSYTLEPFDSVNSPRLIITAVKKQP